jgi:hypothetical protein
MVLRNYNYDGGILSRGVSAMVFRQLKTMMVSQAPKNHDGYSGS